MADAKMGAGPTGNAAAGYSAGAKALHWLVAALVSAQFVVSLLMPDIGPGVKPTTLIDLHLSLGVLIWAVMGLRLVLKLMHPVPLLEDDSPAWQRLAALATHGALYLILIVAPLLGWAAASAHDLPVNVFGLVTLPALAASRAGWALSAGDVHGLAMWVLLGLIVLHAAAALYHFHVRHDGVMQRMLPTRR